MRYLNSLLVLACSFCLLFSCGKVEKGTSEFNKVIYSPRISNGFEIIGDSISGNTLIRVKNPWQGASDITKDFVINYDDLNTTDLDCQSIVGEAKRIVCMSSTHIAMLDALGVIDRVVGVSGLPYISNKYIRENQNKIPDVGYEGSMDYEKLVATKPDLVLLFSINGNSSLEPKLMEFGVPFLYIGDYVEEDPLGKAEWIIPLGEVIGKRVEAVKLFEEISDRYNSRKQMVRENAVTKPKVMLNAPFGDSWFMPSSTSYVARMMQDAGAEYVYNKDTGSSSLPIDMEEALALLQNSDFWLNMGTYSSLNDLKRGLPKFSDVKLVNEGKVFNNNKITSPGGGNDCYESGVLNPDLILRDLIKIFHPELVAEEFVYYHQLK